MTRRTKRLAIAVVLTTIDIAAFNYYCGVIWQTYARYPFAKATLLGLLCLWIASAVVVWLHVAHDFRQIFGKVDANPPFSAEMTPPEFGGDSNV